MRVTAYLQRLSRLERIGQYQFWNKAKNEVSVLGYATLERATVYDLSQKCKLYSKSQND
jgi:hypothetical protein